jgi:glycosyltransferase involved in cell wall biosynthesis
MAGEKNMTPRLSILLCTVETRAKLFAELYAHILKQAEGKPVEVLVACDNKEISIGKKRQNLLQQATGDYVCYVDDDDWVSDLYVDDILAALESGPDCVGFLITCTTNGRNPKSAIASMRYREWAENCDGYAHVRTPYHKTPILRSIALAVGFPDLRYGEDRPFAVGVTARVKTEAFIDKVCYHYRFRNEAFAAKYGIGGAHLRAKTARKFDSRGRPLSY